jgi:hypothetical protein
VPAWPGTVAPATWMTWTITAGVGRGDCDGAVSTGITGAAAGADVWLAAAKPAALAAEMATVSPAVPATPPAVHDAVRRSARSRSVGGWLLDRISGRRHRHPGSRRGRVWSWARAPGSPWLAGSPLPAAVAPWASGGGRLARPGVGQ